ncbi:unnamed protein product [Clonostachys rosea]|uniref:Xylanolytic transcriptional activator regulatory domain-containing protein n=1 Tax=Bionectria ochroleuca TaxID=29856 RepID=A0ABY6UM22_BIOOC|nr:unnamed protein product [Clonostachys rosea]
MAHYETDNRNEPRLPRKKAKRSYIAYLSQLRSSRHGAAIGDEGPVDQEDGPACETRPVIAQDSRATIQDLPVNESRGLHQLDRALEQHFTREPTCLAFVESILKSLNTDDNPSSVATGRQYVQNPAFARQVGHVDTSKFPERIRGTLLVRVALRFIGQDFHLFLQGDFLQQIEKVYMSKGTQQVDALWACKYFVVLALGELYSTSKSTVRHGGGLEVPGTGYFLIAVGLVQDLFEEPSIAQIELMLLFCFYSTALCRVKSAHMYSGMAMRMSTTLSLHRNPPDTIILSPLEREHRIRLWWTVYIFDRSTSLRLGQPVTVHDAEIDVPMPSFSTLPAETRRRVGSPVYLIGHIELARITGSIMQNLYGPLSNRPSSGTLVEHVRTILKKLKKWDAETPSHLRPSYGPINRSVASLQLHFNQCVILITRPVLLHMWNIKRPSFTHRAVDIDPHVSEIAHTLVDACISAARTSNSILSHLFVENALANFGYFDTYYMFSSTVILIISAILSPNPTTSDAVQIAFQLLKGMQDGGNVTAGQYLCRLTQLQQSISQLPTQSTAANVAPLSDYSLEVHGTENRISADPLQSDLESCDWDTLLPLNSAADACNDEGGFGHFRVDSLDSPHLQAFLDTADAGWAEGLGLTIEQMSE